MPIQESSPLAEPAVISQNLQSEGSVAGTDEQPTEMNDCDRAALAPAQMGESDKCGPGDLEESLAFPPFMNGQPRGRVTGAISGKPGSGGKPSRPK